MDEIIYLEPDEEITSVIDKIKLTSVDKIGLVVPRGATLLQSVINLRLLSKEAQNLQKEIAIITADQIGRNLAAQVGLTVFASLNDKTPIFQPSRERPSSHDEVDLSTPSKAVNKSNYKEVAGIRVHHFQGDFEEVDEVEQEEKKTNLEPEPSEKPVERFEKNENLPKERDYDKPLLSPIKNSTDYFEKDDEAPVKMDEKPKIDLPLKKAPSYYHRAGNRAPSGSKFGWVVLFIIVILGGIGAYLLLPKAKVTVYVLASDLNKTQEISVSSLVSESDPLNGILKGDMVEVEKEAKEKFTATGKKNIGVKATGIITITNSWDSDVHKFAVGTKFISQNKTFLAKQAFNLPGASLSQGTMVPGSVKVNVEAENFGEDYNIKPAEFKIVGLSSAMQNGITGKSDTAFLGGLSKEVQVVSQQDYDNAKQKLLSGILDSVNRDVRAKAADEKVLEQAIVQPDPEIISTAQVDQEATEFEMTIRTKIQAMAYNQSSLKELLAKILEQQISQDKMVAIPSDNNVTAQVSKTAYDKGEMVLNVAVAAKIASKVDVEKFSGNLTGKKIAEAEKWLKSQQGVSKVKIDLEPTWFNHIPELERNVKVGVDYISEK